MPLGGGDGDVIARAVADAQTHAQRSLFCMPALFADMFPPDRRVARPWYYYWIPTEWLLRNVDQLAGDASLARPFKRRGSLPDRGMTGYRRSGIAKRGPVCGRCVSRTPPPSEREENGP